MFFKNNDLSNIFWKLLGVSEDILDEYFNHKYTTTTGNETKKLSFSKRFGTALRAAINEKTKKLDLDILF
jgi:hypothetical protein